MLRRLLFAAVLAAHAMASASVVTAHCTPLGDGDWVVNFTVQNDGTLPEIGGFTIYFPEDGVAGLVLDQHPATWDTIVVEPDPGIPASGFLDSFVIDPLDALADGAGISGFQVMFSYQGAGPPGRLAYDIVDTGFVVLESGFTLLATDPSEVSEPITWTLVAIASVGWVLRRRQCRQRLIPACQG